MASYILIRIYLLTASAIVGAYFKYQDIEIAMMFGALFFATLSIIALLVVMVVSFFRGRK